MIGIVAYTQKTLDNLWIVPDRQLENMPVSQFKLAGPVKKPAGPFCNGFQVCFCQRMDICRKTIAEMVLTMLFVSLSTSIPS